MSRYTLPNRADVSERMLRIARRLYEGGEVSVPWIRTEFRVSRATAKRDFLVLELCLPVEPLPRERMNEPRMVRLAARAQ